MTGTKFTIARRRGLFHLYRESYDSEKKLYVEIPRPESFSVDTHSLVFSLEKEVLDLLVGDYVLSNGSQASVEDNGVDPRDPLSRAAKGAGVTLTELKSGTDRKISTWRQAAWYVLRMDYDMSFPKVAALASRDNSTIMSGFKKVKQALKDDDFGTLQRVTYIRGRTDVVPG